MMGSLMGANYFVSILGLNYKFGENLFCVKLIVIKGISLGWVGSNWKNVNKYMGTN